MRKLTWFLLLLMATILNGIGKEPRDFLDDLHWGMETATVAVTELIVQDAFDRAHITGPPITVDEVSDFRITRELETGHDNYIYTARCHSGQKHRTDFTAFIILDPNTRKRRVWIAVQPKE